MNAVTLLKIRAFAQKFFPEHLLGRDGRGILLVHSDQLSLVFQKAEEGHWRILDEATGTEVMEAELLNSVTAAFLSDLMLGFTSRHKSYLTGLQLKYLPNIKTEKRSLDYLSSGFYDKIGSHVRSVYTVESDAIGLYGTAIFTEDGKAFLHTQHPSERLYELTKDSEIHLMLQSAE